MKLFSDIKISETISIALITLLGYIAAFFYEVGRFSILKVPFNYIQINIELILLSSFFTFSISLIAVIFLLLITRIPKTKQRKKKYVLNGNEVVKDSFLGLSIVTLAIPFFFILVLFIFTNLFIGFVIAIGLSLLVLFSGLFFLPPLIHYPEEKNYLAKFHKYQDDQYQKRIELAKKEMKKKKERNTFNDLLSLFDTKEGDPFYGYVKIVIYSIIWATISFVIGALTVSTSNYSISKIENKEYIVLGIYSDNFILVGIDSEKDITTNEILFIKKESGIRISDENVGVINAAQTERSNLFKPRILLK